MRRAQFTAMLAASELAADLNGFVRILPLREDAEETFLEALLDILRTGREHVGQLHAFGFGEHLLRASLGAGRITLQRAPQAADATREHAVALQVGEFGRV